MSEIPAQAAGRQVTDLSTLSTIAGDDYLIIHDATDSKLKKILADRFQSMVKFTTLASLKAATGYTLGQPAVVDDGTSRSGIFVLRSGAPSEAAGDYQGVELTYAGNASYHWRRLRGSDTFFEAAAFGVVSDATYTDNADGTFTVTGTDNYAAFQAAIDAVEDYGGGTLRFSGKVLIDTSTLIVPPTVNLVGDGASSVLVAGSSFPATIAAEGRNTAATYTFPAPVVWKKRSSSNVHEYMRDFKVVGAYNAAHGVMVTGGANHNVSGIMVTHTTDANWVVDAVQNSAFYNCRGDYSEGPNLKVMNSTLNTHFHNFGCRHGNFGQLWVTRDRRYYSYDEYGAGTPADVANLETASKSSLNLTFIGGVWEDTAWYTSGKGSKPHVGRIDCGREITFLGTEFVATADNASAGVTDGGVIINNEGGSFSATSGVRLIGCIFTGTNAECPALINHGYRNFVDKCKFNNWGGGTADSVIRTSQLLDINKPYFGGNSTSGGKYVIPTQGTAADDREQTFDASTISTSTGYITITAHGFFDGEELTYTEGAGAIDGLTDETDYVVRVVDANTIYLELFINKGAIVPASAGSGTATLTPRVGSISDIILTLPPEEAGQATSALTDLYDCNLQIWNTTLKRPGWYDASNNVWIDAEGQFLDEQTELPFGSTPSVRGNRKITANYQLIGTLVSAASTTSVVLPDSFSSIDDFYNGATFALTSGTYSGDSAPIIDYDADTRTLTLGAGISGTPSTDDFTITRANNIVDFSNGKSGQRLVISFPAAGVSILTQRDALSSTRIVLADNQDWTPPAGSMLILEKQNITPFHWHEIARHVPDSSMAGERVAYFELTSAQILALNSTSVEILAAPGAGKALCVNKIVTFYDFNSTAYATTADIQYRYTNSGGDQVVYSFNQLNATADKIQRSLPLDRVTLAVNADLRAFAPSANPTAGDSPVYGWIYYNIVEV